MSDEMLSNDESSWRRRVRGARRGLLFGLLGALVSLSSASANAVSFPLKISSNSRYLVDQDNTPFRVQSDAGWLISTRTSGSDVDTYLADRKQRGFNTFVLMNIVNTGYMGSEPPNRNGDAPFTKPGDFSTPNEAYFSYIDGIIDKAAAQGMLVLFFYTYLGYQGLDQGWWSIVNNSANTQAVCQAWGQWLGNRYKNKPNIIWMVGGDYSPPADASTPSGEGRTRVHKILEGIRSAGAKQLAGAQWFDPADLATDQAGFTHGIDPTTSDLNINTFYGMGTGNDGFPYRTADAGWKFASPVLPTLLFEPPYEGEQNIPQVSAAREATRTYQWWSTLSGSVAGQCWGSHGVWPFPSGWQANLNSPGAGDVAVMFKLFQSFAWYTLAPSGTAAGYYGRNIVASGQGSGSSYIAASGTTTGNMIIAFVPPTGTASVSFAIDLRSMSGSSRARWLDPSSGSFRDISGGAYAISNTQAAQSFSTPGTNQQGTNDWVLVLDATTAGGAGSGSGGSGSGGASGSAGSQSSGGRASAGGASSGNGGRLGSGGTLAMGSGGVSSSVGGGVGGASAGSAGIAGSAGRPGTSQGGGGVNAAGGVPGQSAGGNGSSGAAGGPVRTPAATGGTSSGGNTGGPTGGTTTRTSQGPQTEASRSQSSGCNIVEASRTEDLSPLAGIGLLLGLVGVRRRTRIRDGLSGEARPTADGRNKIADRELAIKSICL